MLYVIMLYSLLWVYSYTSSSYEGVRGGDDTQAFFNATLHPKDSSSCIAVRAAPQLPPTLILFIPGNR